MHTTFEKIFQLCGAYFLLRNLHSLLQKISQEIEGNIIARRLHAILNPYLFNRSKSALSIVKLKSQTKKSLQKSNYRTAKLLRRDLRNKALLFKFMRLKK